MQAMIPLAQVRVAERGAKVGYLATYEVKREHQVIGVIAVGYADGLKRFCSNRDAAVYWTVPSASRGQVKCPAGDDHVNREPLPADGKTTFRLPMLGIVSMDSVMVDLTDVPADVRPKEGDFVELMGPHQPPGTLATFAGSNGYEILTSLGRRYEREFE
jgi:alanine racemase